MSSRSQGFPKVQRVVPRDIGPNCAGGSPYVLCVNSVPGDRNPLMNTSYLLDMILARIHACFQLKPVMSPLRKPNCSRE
jgi:hypothetical protein